MYIYFSNTSGIFNLILNLSVHGKRENDKESLFLTEKLNLVTYKCESILWTLNKVLRTDTSGQPSYQKKGDISWP